jgi:hypothetical protein
MTCRFLFVPLLCLLATSYVLADDAVPASSNGRFLQRLSRTYPLDSTDVPQAVKLEAAAKPWDHWEKGPTHGIRELARTHDKVVWLGSADGAARFDPNAAYPWDRWQYFWGRRWLKDNDVVNIWIDESAPHETAWIRTATGVSCIELKPMTLAEKAAHYEIVADRRHVRHGFVSGSVVKAPDDLTSSQTRDDDNDGLWTAMYLAAQSYRYAATGDADARAKAERSLRALMRLETIDLVEGFFARSYRTHDEPTFGHPEGEWHRLADGKTEWKGDTSSDEQVGHYYAYAVYFDLVANDAEKEEIKRHVARMTDYLLVHGDELLDVDGQPTRWGRFSPAYYATEEGAYEKPLRCLEFLSFLKTTHHITGDEKYSKAYRQRVERGDAQATRLYRRWDTPVQEINYSDDELYYLSIYPLLKYEQNPQLREIYLDSLRFTWSQVRRENNPLWNFISLALTGEPLSPVLKADSFRTLERTPWDLRDWRVENSQRQDVALRPERDRHGRPELIHLLAPDERAVHKHNSSPFYADDGGGGGYEEAPTFWLLPYWMARHYGFSL